MQYKAKTFSLLSLMYATGWHVKMGKIYAACCVVTLSSYLVTQHATIPGCHHRTLKELICHLQCLAFL